MGMEQNPESLIREYAENGFLIFRNFFQAAGAGRYLDAVSREIEAMGDFLCPGFKAFEAGEFGKLTEAKRSNLYTSSRHLVSLFSLAASEEMRGVAGQIGLKHPGIMPFCNIRMDLPGDQPHLFHWHQDTAYLLGSMNACTFWIPLTPTDREKGSIEVIAQSHLRGVLPVTYRGERALDKRTTMSPKDLFLEEEPEENGIVLETRPGDLVVFSQLLLHRSIPNLSRRIRWTIQLRYADLMDAEFAEAGYPFGNTTNIFHAGLKKEKVENP